MQNLSYVNEFESHGNEPVGETYCRMNDFAQRFVLRGQRQPGNGSDDSSVPLTHLWMSESLKVILVCLITF